MFHWQKERVVDYLPIDWREQTLAVARTYSTTRQITPTSVTSRESSRVKHLTAIGVDGHRTQAELPWLYDFYASVGLQFARDAFGSDVVLSSNPSYAVVLNILIGDKMRYESHVDSNPVEGLLYVSTLKSGGELRVANSETASTTEEIDEDMVEIKPRAGDFVLFNASANPHYVRGLDKPCDIRVVAAMNYYNGAITEAMRPPDLNMHLFGKEV